MSAAVIVLLLSSVTAHTAVASTTDPCVSLKGDDKIMCQGVTKLDMRKCEQLPFEKKRECMNKIVDIQRKNK